MEPSLCVLIYSKYSSECKKVFGILQNSGLDLSQQLQLLCIDNIEIRKRIGNSISHVPCIVCMYPPNVKNRIEKLYGPYALTWIEKLIESAQPIMRAQPIQASAPPQPRPVQQVPNQEALIDELSQEDYSPTEYPTEPISEPTRTRVRTQPSRPPSRPSRRRVVQREEVLENLEDICEAAGPKGDIEPLMEPETQSAKKHYTRRPVKAEELEESPNTDDFIQPEEAIREALSDRHRTVAQPKRLRQNDQQYIESEELFGGDVPDARRPPSHVTKADAQNRTTQDPHGVMARAKALAMGRDAFDKETANPANRPMVRQN